jgi:transposase-like protein
VRKPRATDYEKENHWRAVFAQFQKCGLPFRKFCAQEKISPNTFQYWRRELRNRDEARGTVSTISKGDNRSSNLQQKINHWLKIIDEINVYEGSINSYCRIHGVSSGNLHFWEKRLREMKLTNGVRKDGKHSRAGSSDRRSARPKPTFVSLKLGPETTSTTNGAVQPKIKRSLDVASGSGQVAAELVHTQTGCQVRIFNGADRSTLAALVAALSLGQSIEF